MIGLIKKILLVILFLVSSVNSLECVSMKNQECKVRPKIIIMTCIILLVLK